MNKIKKYTKTPAPLAEIFFRVKGEVRVLENAIKKSDNTQVLKSRVKLKELILILDDSLVHSRKDSFIDHLIKRASFVIKNNIKTLHINFIP